ncbi:MAG: hypothetical protein PGN13_01245 [Patulibacter minatonensis]
MARLPKTRAGRLAAFLLTIAAFPVILIAQRDLGSRPSEQVRGPKLLWRLLCANAAGAVAYLVFGRRTD